MNSGVRLVQSYLHLNGYFTVSELPVIRQRRRGDFVEVTDLDLLAVRFPRAEYVVPRGEPGRSDDLHMRVDPVLVDDRDVMDVIVAEVKEGKARVNDTLRSAAALETALRRVGCCPESALSRTVEELARTGEASLTSREAGIPARIRLVAFGSGATGERAGYEVISMKHIAEYVADHLDRYHEVLQPADLGDTPLGLLHLLRKLR